MPSVVGASLSSARSSLEGAGFTVSVSYDYSDTVDKGNVISQSPDGGSAKKGSQVSIVVSNGPENTSVDVPYVVGMDEDAAARELDSAGFVANTVYMKSNTVPAGQVIKQSATSAKKGSTITITISEGSGSSTGTDE